MDIIGTGFLARHLRPLGDAHPAVTVLAAGVPRHPLPDTEHEREAALVRATVRDCLARGRRLVFCSTLSMYGGPGCRGMEDDPIVPSTRYGRHKHDLERLIQDSGVRHLILRLGYVLGPHGPDFRLVPALITQLRAGRIRIQRGARRDMVYVADFVVVLDRLLASRSTDDVVNLASGDCVEISRVVDHLERRLGITAVREYVDGTISHCASVDKLRRLVPEVAGLGFAAGYHRTAIDRYLDATGSWPARGPGDPAAHQEDARQEEATWTSPNR